MLIEVLLHLKETVGTSLYNVIDLSEQLYIELV